MVNAMREDENASHLTFCLKKRKRIFIMVLSSPVEDNVKRTSKDQDIHVMTLLVFGVKGESE